VTWRADRRCRVTFGVKSLARLAKAVDDDFEACDHSRRLVDDDERHMKKSISELSVVPIDQGLVVALDGRHGGPEF
jgi:hypothetical protein